MAGSGRKNANERLIATLASGKTVQAAAQLCEVSERTIYRRLQDARFRRRIVEARARMLERAIGHLSAGSAEAAITLRNLLRVRDDPRVRLGAARAVLELGHKVRETVDLEARIAELERRLDEKGKKP